MKPDNIGLRHGEHAEGIVIAKVLLFAEGKFREIIQGFQIIGMDTCRIEPFPKERNIPVCMRQTPFKTIELQGRYFIPAGNLDRIKLVLRRWGQAHVSLICYTRSITVAIPWPTPMHMVQSA